MDLHSNDKKEINLRLKTKFDLGTNIKFKNKDECDVTIKPFHNFYELSVKGKISYFSTKLQLMEFIAVDIDYLWYKNKEDKK